MLPPLSIMLRLSHTLSLCLCYLALFPSFSVQYKYDVRCLKRYHWINAFTSELFPFQKVTSTRKRVYPNTWPNALAYLKSVMDDDRIRRNLLRQDSGGLEAVAAQDEDGVRSDGKQVPETDGGWRIGKEERSQFRSEMNEPEMSFEFFEWELSTPPKPYAIEQSFLRTGVASTVLLCHLGPMLQCYGRKLRIFVIS